LDRELELVIRGLARDLDDARLADRRALALQLLFEAELLLELLADVEVLDERVEVLAQDLRGLDQRHLGRDRAVSPDLEDELVVVRELADARVLGLVLHAAHGREERGDRDDPDLLLRAGLVLVGRAVAAATLDRELALEVAVLGQRR